MHDTIVIFDRIRENINKYAQLKFGQVVNISITESLTRSLGTSLTLVFVLIAMFLFGGESIRWFVFALLVGIVVGTYSSIFNAAQNLTTWEEWRERKSAKKIVKPSRRSTPSSKAKPAAA